MKVPKRCYWLRVHLPFQRHKRHGFNPWIRKIPWRRKWQPTPVFLPRKSHGQKSLAGQSVGSQRVGHNLATQHTHLNDIILLSIISVPDI